MPEKQEQEQIKINLDDMDMSSYIWGLSTEIMRLRKYVNQLIKLLEEAKNENKNKK